MDTVSSAGLALTGRVGGAQYAEYVQICASCGEELSDHFRFCGFCGSPLAGAALFKETRKTVTVLFCDLKGSTNLGEVLDEESLREVVSNYFERMSVVLEDHGGSVERFIGDAVMAVFGLRTAHEDDALRAVRAAYEMQATLADFNSELARGWGITLTNRTGVNTGDVVAGEPVRGQQLVVGDAVNVAARLEQAAGDDEVLIGGLTYRLVRDAVEVEPAQPLDLKGKSEPVPAYRLLSLKREQRGTRRRSVPIVGREAELDHLRRELEAATTERRVRMVTVLGEPGVGKSTLTDALAAAVEDDALVVSGRCLPYGRGITFWPLLEVVQDAAGITESDGTEEAGVKLAAVAGEERPVVERLASALGMSSDQFSVEETFWAARKLLERMATQRPLVVAFEDIHWAELTFLDLIEHLVGSGEAPILLVCLARRELLELRQSWGGQARASFLALEPLSDDDIGRVMEGLLGSAELAGHVRSRIVETAGGNPLYVEQMLSMMIDDGALRQEDGRWRPAVDLDQLDVPPSIQALLTARLDRLKHEERNVIEPASVIGVTFPNDAVQDLVDPDLRGQVGVHLSSLSARQLIHPEATTVAGEGYRFDHILIRDAAYGRLLKRERAILHERFVDWGERASRERQRESEFEEIIGYHLEQAYHYLSELGPVDAHGQKIGARAAARLSSAGRRAFTRGDMPAASNLLRRAAALLTKHDVERLELLPDLGEALMETGEFAPAQVFLDEAVAAASATDHAALRARGAVARLLVGVHSADPERWSSQLKAELEEAIEVLDDAQDHTGLAAAYRLQSMSLSIAGNVLDATRVAERAMEHAATAGDERRRRLASCQYAQLATYGPTPVSEAIPQCEQILEQGKGDKRTEGLLMHVLSRLYAMRGEFDRARSLYTTSRLTLEETGRTVAANATSIDSCAVEMLAGNPAAAERELRRDYAALEEMGEKLLLSTISAEIARAAYEQGDHDEAERLTYTAQELAAEDDIEAEALWRSVRAKVLARRQEVDDARALAGEAVDLLHGTGSLVSEADAVADLGEVLRLSGQPAEARDTFERAAGLYECKGDDVSVARVRSSISALSEYGAPA
jgi:class 3 adenylate cyclase/tetratricopeptide (TPR) repeat protein